MKNFDQSKGNVYPKQIQRYLINNQPTLLPDASVPYLYQIQSFVNRNRPRTDARNSSEKKTSLTTYVKENRFNPDIHLNETTKPFVYSAKFDSNDDPSIVNNAGDSRRLHISMTSIRLLDKINTSNHSLNCGMFHIDSSLRLSDSKYAVLVFGRTDMRNTFHPIAFMLTSHLDRYDFWVFYSELKNFLCMLNTFSRVFLLVI